MGYWDPTSWKQNKNNPMILMAFLLGIIICHLLAPSLFTKLSICFTAIWKLPYLPRMEVWNVLAIMVPSQHSLCCEWRESDQNGGWGAGSCHLLKACLSASVPCGWKAGTLHRYLLISLYSAFDNICNNYMGTSFKTLKLKCFLTFKKY